MNKVLEEDKNYAKIHDQTLLAISRLGYFK